jgi:hypothetical protein
MSTRRLPFWFSSGSDYVDELHGGALDFYGIVARQ